MQEAPELCQGARARMRGSSMMQVSTFSIFYPNPDFRHSTLWTFKIEDCMRETASDGSFLCLFLDGRCGLSMRARHATDTLCAHPANPKTTRKIHPLLKPIAPSGCLLDTPCAVRRTRSTTKYPGDKGEAFQPSQDMSDPRTIRIYEHEIDSLLSLHSTR